MNDTNSNSRDYPYECFVQLVRGADYEESKFYGPYDYILADPNLMKGYTGDLGVDIALEDDGGWVTPDGEYWDIAKIIMGIEIE